MAHTFDTKLRDTTVSDDPFDILYTCGASATVLVVGIASGVNTRTGGAPTYDGNALEEAPNSPQSLSSDVTVELWYLLDPPTGSSLTLSIPNTGTDVLRVHISSFISSTGTSALDVDAGDTGTVAIATQAVTPSVDGSVIVDMCNTGHNDLPSANSQTTLFSVDAFNNSDNSQYALQGTAAGITFSWTQDGADNWAIIVAAFKEVSAGGGAPIFAHHLKQMANN